MTGPGGGDATLRVGTRGSALALAQTRALAARFSGVVEIVEVTTQGDIDPTPLSMIGGAGVFVSALRDALLDGRVDVAVHSMKDLPTDHAFGITLAAVAEREDPRDALCARDGLTLATLPHGAKVGTGSPRRAAQLRLARTDLQVVDIRGNVPSRLARAQGDPATGLGADLDAVVLALAGLRRLGLESSVTEVLDLDLFPTAPAQGALAVEVRAGDDRSRLAVAGTDHPATRAAAEAERMVLAGLDGGCSAPLAASALVAGGRLRLSAAVYAVDGSRRLSASAATDVGGDPAELDVAVRGTAAKVLVQLLEAGVLDLIS